MLLLYTLLKTWNFIIFIFTKLFLKQLFDFFMVCRHLLKRKYLFSIIILLHIELFKLAVDIFYTLFAYSKIVI